MNWKQEFGDVKGTNRRSEGKKRDNFFAIESLSGQRRDEGYHSCKKEEILKKLSPFLLLQNRVKFWQDIPSTSNSKDLTVNIEHLSKDI